MKNATSLLKAFLANPANDHWFKADLYEISLISGATLYYTDWDRQLVVNGHTYSAAGPYLKRTRVTTTIGLEVSTMELDILADPTMQLSSTAFIQAIASGALSGAGVLVERIIMPMPGDVSLGTYIVFGGNVSDIPKIGRGSAQVNLKSSVEAFNMNLPKELVSPGCGHTLYDTGCGLTKADWQVSGSVTGGNKLKISTNLTQPGPVNPPASAPGLSHSAGPDGTNLPPRTYYVQSTYVTTLGESTASPEATLAIPANHLLTVASPGSGSGVTGWNVYVADSPGNERRQNGATVAIGTAYNEPAIGVATDGASPPLVATGGYFSQGVIRFTSGPNNGVGRSVQQYYSDGSVVVVPPLPALPVAGNTFVILPGCDKAMSTCGGKFNNLVNFRGFPFVPRPETSI